MKASRGRAILQEPFVCQQCLISRTNARPSAQIDRNLLRAIAVPPQRQSSLLSRPRHVYLPLPVSRVAGRTFASAAQRSAKKPPGRILVRPSTQARKPSKSTAESSDLLKVSQNVADTAQGLVTASTAPEEIDVLEVLDKCYAISEVVVFGKTDHPSSDLEGLSNPSSATSSLLGLQEENGGGAVTRAISSDTSSASIEVRQQASQQIIAIVNELIRAPPIFISPAVLELYVRIACLLGSPEAIPEVFTLYANKPIPTPKTSPIQYSPSKPKAASNAIPKPLAEAALSSAIATKNLPLALSLIDTTVKAPAWFRRKILKEASLPILASSALPFVAYAAATTLGDYQVTTTPTMATGLAFTGIMTYFVVTGTFGYVALTTFNDHHQRVRWRNIPLTERWIREDERAMWDKVALGWGFKEKWRWGEEEGEEWEAIREFCGRRGMILDRTELLEGME